MNPYQTPASLAVEATPLDENGRLWQIKNGNLWVRDGASLPDVCLYGSEPDRGAERAKLKLVLYSRVGRWIEAIFLLVGLGALGWATSLGVQSLFTFSAMMIAIVVGSLLMTTGLGALIRYRTVIEIHCSVGNQGRRVFLISGSLMIGAIIIAVLAIRGARWVGLTERMEMGAFFMFIFGTSWLQGRVRGWFVPKAGEIQAGWFKLKNIHPSAVARLEEIQQRAGSIK